MTDLAPQRPLPAAGWHQDAAFVRRVLIVAAIAALALLLWSVRDALLLAFGAVVVATILNAAARPFERHLRLSHGWALAAAGLVILALLGGAGVLMGEQIRAQIAQLTGQLPDALRGLEQRFGITLPRPEGQSIGSQAIASTLQQIAYFGGTLLDGLSAFALAVVGGAYLAAAAAAHRRGLVKLLPRSQQAPTEDALRSAGQALHLWLMGQLVSMLVVGVLVTLGTWAIGLPAPLALGLFAGLTEFIPVLGPVIGAVPALLLAVSEGSGPALWTLALFVVVQQAESNLLTPLIQQRMADIPPTLLLFAAVAFGALFGLPGVILAAPLAVVAYVLVQKLYVQRTLGQPVEVAGEAAAAPRQKEGRKEG